MTYVAAEMQSSKRASMGWEYVDQVQVEVITVRNDEHIDKLVSRFSKNSIHIVQGVYANGVMERVRRHLKRKNLRWGVAMEGVDERSWKWPLKRLVYSSRLSLWSTRPDFILATGRDTPDWIAARGYPREKIFSFTYFISPPANKKTDYSQARATFRIGFVGQLIPRKRVDVLIDALSGLGIHEFELVIVGDGPLAEDIKSRGVEKLGKDRFSMVGILSMNEIPNFMSTLDCFVLPSDHDGWGVVVSEALMSGVPAVCSDACGASEAVIASGVGGIFPKGDVRALRSMLAQIIGKGRLEPSRRLQLARWARCLGAEAGAEYLSEILACVYGGASRPVPPWKKAAAILSYGN